MTWLKKLFILLTILSTVAYSQQSELLLKAEDFSFKSVGGPAKPGWNIWSNGYLSESFNFPEEGEYKVTITARGRKAAGTWPLMRVVVRRSIDFNTEVSSREYKEFTYNLKFNKGYNTVKIYFLNDYFEPLLGDRNLYINEVRIKAMGTGAVPRVLTADERVKGEAEAWRKIVKETADRIERIRKGDLEIIVVDKNNKPVKGVEVKVEQSRHEFWFGTAITSHIKNMDAVTKEKFFKILKDNFNSAVPENAMKWPATEREQGKFKYEDLDNILAWCEENKFKVRGHCIFWEAPENIQLWLKILSDDDLRAAIRKRGGELTARYKGRVGEYDVNNEMLHCFYYKDRFGEKIWKEMFDSARKGDPSALLYVNDYDIMTNGYTEEKFVKHIQGLLDMGIPVGGIGIQGHFDSPVDPYQVGLSLELLSKFNLPIKITEFDVYSTDEKMKADSLEALYRVSFSYPKVEGILMWGFWAGEHWRPEAAIYKKDFTPTPSAEIYRKLVYDEWWTKEAGKTDANGKYNCRAFFGEHKMTVTMANGKSIARTIDLSSKEVKKNLRFTIDD